MFNELTSIQKRIDECRKDLFSMHQKLDPDKNRKSREEIMAVQLEIMKAQGKINQLIDKINRAKTKKEGEE